MGKKELGKAQYGEETEEEQDVVNTHIQNGALHPFRHILRKIKVKIRQEDSGKMG